MSLPRVAVLVCLCSLSGCDDPYLDNLIEELGEEQEGYAPSKIHRPGQPCVLCHSEYDGAEPILSFGGTLFAEPLAGDDPLVLLEGYTIRLIDSVNQMRNLTTNKCGNFYITKEAFDPAFPVRAEVWGPASPAGGDVVQLIVMTTRIGRDGSCGTCHANPASPFSPGVVFVPNAYLTGATLETVQGCPTPKFADPL